MDQNQQGMAIGNTKVDAMTSNHHMKSPGWTKGWALILDKERGYTEEEWEAMGITWMSIPDEYKKKKSYTEKEVVIE